MKSQSMQINNVYVDSIGMIVGKLEKEGPLKKYFNNYIEDNYFGEKSFELAQKKLSNKAILNAIAKSRYNINNVDIAIGGDLSNQIYCSTSSVEEFTFPFVGVYAACASFNLSIILGSIYLYKKLCNNALCFTSSHNGVSEKQFRYPNEYGIQKHDTNTSTVTAGVATILSNQENKIKVSAFTIGKVIDILSKNVNDMGTCMAYAAFDTLKEHLNNLHKNINEYDKIITGDLSYYGSEVFLKLCIQNNINIENRHSDCGLMIFDRNNQDVNAGGSGPACCPVVTFSYFIDKMVKKEYKRILVIATGALHSQVSFQQKQSIPCIAHAIELEVNNDY